MVTCPICMEMLDVLTSVHCLGKHGITKSQVISQYGKPKQMSFSFSAQTTGHFHTIEPHHFLDSQLLTARMRSKSRKFHT